MTDSELETEAGSEAEPRPEWRRIALGGVLALLVGAGVVLLIGRAAGFSKLSSTLRGADPEWLAVCAAGQVVVFAGYTGVYRAAVRFEGGPEIDYRLSLRVVLASFGLTQLVAAGGAAALAITYWALRRVGNARRDALVRLIGLNTFVYFVFALIGLGAAVAALVLDTAPLAMTLPWIVIIPTLLLAARWFTAPARVAGWAQDRGGWLRRALGVGVAAAWWVRRAVSTPDGRTLAPWAVAYWGGAIASVWAGLHAFGADVSVTALVLAFTTGYAAQAIPLPFVATGGVDAAMTFALTAIGVPLEQALLGVVAYRVFAFWLPLVPALVLAAMLPATGHRLEAAGRAASLARPAGPG